MFAALHPVTCLRLLGPRSGWDADALKRLLGIQATLGKAVPRPEREPEVRFLGTRGRSASAEMDLGPWTALIHLASYRGGWRIAHILWEWRRR